MLDFEKAQKAFQEYLQQYDTQDGKIVLKIKHTYAVVEKSEYLAKCLKLDQNHIQLAKIIALLHDIGRFEQVKQTENFSDVDGFDHAKYGVKILFEDGMIRKFVDETGWDNIIHDAIEQHNQYEITGILAKMNLLHCQIIRDADKLDNFRVKEEEPFENIFPQIYNPETIEYETISPKVYKDFMERRCILAKDRQTQLDYWVCCIAFLFDLNFSISIQYVRDNHYVDRLLNRINYRREETKKKIENIRECANEYMEERGE